jgi:hypothetical protein
LETFDVAKSLSFVKIVFKLRHSNLDCGKADAGRCLSSGPYRKEATCRHRRGDECQHSGRFQ